MRTITKVTTAALAGAAGMAVLAAAALPASAQTDDDAAPQSVLEDRLSRLKEALSGLVTDGTLSQEEADAVASTLNDSDLFRGPGPGDPGMPGPHAVDLGVAADTLGLTGEELRTALHEGQTLAEIANDQAVPPADLVDALVQAATERIDDAVADGSLDEARAAELKADLATRISELVNEGMPMRGGPGGGANAQSEDATATS